VESLERPKAVPTLAVAAVAAVIVFPFVLTVLNSLKPLGEIYAPTFSVYPKIWSWSNYVTAVTRGNWPRYIWNSVYVSFFAIVFSLIINSMAGYAFAKMRFRGRDLLFFLALIGIMIPPQITMVPVFIILKHVPFLGGNDWLGQGGTGLLNTREALVIPHVAGSFGVFLCRQFFLGLPSSLDEAAKIDGCSHWKTYLLIYLPLSKPLLATLAILKGVYSWNEYSWPLILTNTDKMRTVQIGLTMFRSDQNIEWHLLMAAAVVITLPLIITYLFLQRYFVQGIATTGIKG
jgi:multiple sugar transport system permease protein